MLKLANEEPNKTQRVVELKISRTMIGPLIPLNVSHSLTLDFNETRIDPKKPGLI